MAEEMKSHDDQVVDKQDRGLFDFMKKDENSSKPHDQEAAVSESADHFKEKVKIEDEKEKAHEKQEEEEEKKKPSLLEKLHRSNSSSSSSSSDEEGEGEEKKKKKKKEKKVEDTAVPVEKVEEHQEEQGKKRFLEKIKDKLPGGANKTQDQNPAAAAAEQHPHEPSPTAGSDKEKKGFLDKIKEKLPGYHPSNTQDQTAGPQDHSN